MIENTDAEQIERLNARIIELFQERDDLLKANQVLHNLLTNREAEVAALRDANKTFADHAIHGVAQRPLLSRDIAKLMDKHGISPPPPPQFWIDLEKMLGSYPTQTTRVTCTDCGKRDPCDDDCPNAAIIKQWNEAGKCFAEILEVDRLAMRHLTGLPTTVTSTDRTGPGRRCAHGKLFTESCPECGYIHPRDRPVTSTDHCKDGK
jgi:hypothetical protein